MLVRLQKEYNNLGTPAKVVMFLIIVTSLLMLGVVAAITVLWC